MYMNLFMCRYPEKDIQGLMGSFYTFAVILVCRQTFLVCCSFYCPPLREMNVFLVIKYKALVWRND